MATYNDEDGIDGPFERAMRRAMREDAAKLRRRTSRKLAGLELPDAFAQATVVSEATILARPKSKRRIADKRDLKALARKAKAVDR